MFTSAVPVQLQGERPVDGGEAQQTDPTQEDAAENAGLEIQNPHLMEDREREREDQPRTESLKSHSDHLLKKVLAKIYSSSLNHSHTSSYCPQ